MTTVVECSKPGVPLRHPLVCCGNEPLPRVGFRILTGVGIPKLDRPNFYGGGLVPALKKIWIEKANGLIDVLDLALDARSVKVWFVEPGLPIKMKNVPGVSVGP